MINVKNSQRKIAINTEQIISQAQQILDITKYSDFDLGIWITTNKSIRQYNKEYRNKDKATDILSFPYHTDLQAGKRIKICCEEDQNLGDLIISAEYVVEEAKKYNVTFEERMKILLVHGVCHVLGYDHIIDADYRRMRAKEAYILKRVT